MVNNYGHFGDQHLTSDLLDYYDLEDGDTAPDSVQRGNGMLTWSYDIADDSYLFWKLPNDYKEATDISIYIGWTINEAYATANGEVQWLVTWSAIPTDASETIAAPTHTGTIDSGDINIPATALTIIESDLGDIAAASLTGIDILDMDIERVALDGGVNPTADPEIVYVRIEYARLFPVYDLR